MEVIIGKTAGFCFGVKNAVTKTLEEIEKQGEIYCLGELVHNNQVTEDLSSKGVKFIDDIEDAENNVIIRSHGVQKEIYEKAKNLKLKLVDLTCPKVLHIHKIAEEYAQKGYYIFVIGKKEHPEMIGTVSFCGKNYYVIQNEDEVINAIDNFKKSNIDKALIISQTTFSLEKFKAIVEKLQANIEIENLEIKNTICNATRERQEETKEIAKQVDIMIIIGGKHSSNSNKLNELAKKYCKNVIFVETAEEIDIKNIEKTAKIGVMAGASTPEESIKKVVEKINKIC